MSEAVVGDLVIAAVWVLVAVAAGLAIIMQR